MRSVEIVTHCWKYSKALAWQIASIVTHYGQWEDEVHITVLLNIEGDKDTWRLVDPQSPANVRWHNLPLPKLFNRAIGRNWCAKSTDADWVWFCDADYVFGPKCLRELAGLPPEEYTLVYPQTVHISKTHEIGDHYLKEGPKHGLLSSDFKPKRMGKAIGGCQIVPGSIAREHGYCRWKRAQQPVEGDSMADTKSDRAFRVSLGTPGTPIELSDVYRIRHSTSGLARTVGGRERWTGN